MKILLNHAKIFVCLLITGAMFLIACDKRNRVDTPPFYLDPLNHNNPLSGKEFRFDSLFWDYNDLRDIVAVYIVNRPDLFGNPGIYDVFLKQDTSHVWLPVVLKTSHAQFSGFIYGTGPTSIVVWSVPPDVSLIGKPVSIKIKFM